MKKVAVSVILGLALSILSTVPSHADSPLTIEEESITTSPSSCWSDVQSFKYDVVGESHRRSNIDKALVVAQRSYSGFMINTANLIPEPSNKYDKYAIKIVTSNIHIGYVPRKYSKIMSSYLKTKKAKNIPLCVFWDDSSVGYQAFLNMDPYFKSINKFIKSWRDDQQISK
jgi:hypothetical protein